MLHIVGFYLLLSTFVTAQNSNNCSKWLQSIDNSFPYLSKHNGYHIRETHEFTVSDNNKVNVTQPRFAYTSQSFTDQLSNGVVGLELDIWPQNDVSGSNDFPVYHYLTDTKSSCATLRICLNEINEWYILNKDVLLSPLLIYIDIRSWDDYSYTELQLINTIWFNIFNASDLYTPNIHNHGSVASLNDAWRDWSNVCYDTIKNKIIPVMDRHYTEVISPDDEILLPQNLNMFINCDCQNQGNYCTVLRGDCGDDINLKMNTTKYLYRKYSELTQQYPQWNEYPFIYNNSVAYGQHLLGLQIDNELLNEIQTFANDITNPLKVNEWFYWQTAAYIDGMNNNNGIFEQSDLIKYLKVMAPDQPIDLMIKILFWKDDWQEWNVLNPQLWSHLQCVYTRGGYGLDEFVINIDFNLSTVLNDICDNINKGIHYLFTDYAYDWDNFQDFTMTEIEANYSDICNDITITTTIDKSLQTSDCTSKSQLISFMIGVGIGLLLLFIVIIIIISLIIDRCCCESKCQRKCCKCCPCCKKKDEVNDSVQDSIAMSQV